MLDAALRLASWGLLTGGGLFMLIGGIGVLRMPNLYTRLHAAGITDSIGPILVIGGLLLQAGLSLESLKLLAILLFMMITGPTASHALANAALMAGVRLSCNDQTNDRARRS